MHWQWDPVHNCVLQAKSTLIDRALNDFPLYNLMATTQPPTMVTTLAITNKPPLEAQAQADQHATMGAQSANDLDNISNSTLLQGTWFTTTTKHLDVITAWQNKLETQMNTQFTTIMMQLESIWNSMEEQWRWQDSYNKYNGYDRDRPFTPDQLHMEEDSYDTANDMLAPQHKPLAIPRWKLPVH